MKVAVMNFSGNVGKTTVSRNLLMPRVKEAEYISVETINSDEGDSDQIRGKQFGQLQEELMLLDAAIVDVGSSNVEEFVKLMSQYRGSHEEFDYFVIPVVKEKKQIRDTIATIQALHAMGIPAKKILVVFNAVEVDDSPEDLFYPIYLFHEDKKFFTLKKDAVINYSELYQRLRQYGVSIEGLLNDKTDHRAGLKTAKSQEEKDRAIAMISMRRLALSASENLDAVFAALMK